MTAITLREFVTAAEDNGRRSVTYNSNPDLYVELAKTEIDGAKYPADAFLVVVLGVDRDPGAAQIHVKGYSFEPELATVQDAIRALEQVARVLSGAVTQEDTPA